MEKIFFLVLRESILWEADCIHFGKKVPSINVQRIKTFLFVDEALKKGFIYLPEVIALVI